MAGDNVSTKWSEKKMEGEERLRTMECLRGRLLAERAASKVANEETEQIGRKLIELENQLKTEIKSRNRAEKRLKFLLQKLESLNISYVSDEYSNNSSNIEKSEISSISSTASSSNKQAQNYQEIQATNSTNCEIEEPIKKIKSQASSTTTYYSDESHNWPSHEGCSGASDEGISGNSYGSQCSQDEETMRRDDERLKSFTEKEEEINEENDHNHDDSIDNSLALVVVDPPAKEQAIDPPISNASVKEVLDTLRHVRESIQSSIQRRPMIRVGSR